ncbi:MAG: hypothetical protein ACRETL_16830, partial [Gammaproteobacteria bacterium]
MESQPFSTLAAAAGVVVNRPPKLGHVTRYPTVEHPHSLNAAILLRPDGSGWLMRWDRDAAPVPFGKANAIDRHTTIARRAIVRVAKLERTRMHTEAAERAHRILKLAKLAGSSHPYLVRKGLASVHGAKLYRQALVIPYGDGSKNWTLQFIDSEGRKRFLRGGRKAGCYACIGARPLEGFDKLVICEGWATGAS